MSPEVIDLELIHNGRVLQTVEVAVLGLMFPWTPNAKYKIHGLPAGCASTFCTE